MSQQHAWHPRITCYVQHCGDTMVYFGPNDQVAIAGNPEMQNALLGLCTGHKTAQEVIGIMSAHYDRAQIEQLLEVLREQNLVVDSRNYWRAYHVYTCNPMPFTDAITEEEALNLVRQDSDKKCERIAQSQGKIFRARLANLLTKRRSQRLYTGDEISEDSLLYLVWCCYGETSLLLDGVRRRTVPSAGGLYPLRIHVVLRPWCGRYCPGVYELDRYKTALVLTQKWDLSYHETFASCFLDDSYVHNYAACVVINADIVRESIKYSNRGYRYAILEAGHAAQNILLACAEQNLGCVEVGGFSDFKLKEILSLGVNTFPLTTVFVGKAKYQEGEK